MNIYFDNAATTPVAPEVLAAMMPFFGNFFGNPSSLHAFGQDARRAMEAARAELARLINADPDEIVFTSGGTESDNFAVKGVAGANRDRGNHIITTKIEHHAVLEPCHVLENQGFRVTYLDVDEYGLVSPEDVIKAITPETILVSVMHANNEIGTVEPIAEIGQITRDMGIYLHTDAVQTVGHLPIDVQQMNVDLLSSSAHKLSGPKGIGFLYIRKGTKMAQFMHGGGQEKNRRASTQNVPGIVGFGKAAEIALKEMDAEIERLTGLRDRFIREVLARVPHARLNGHPQKRLPNNINLSAAYVEGEALVLNLDMQGVAASTGSACTSGSFEPSHILKAIGLPLEMSQGSIRFTLGRITKDEEVDYVIGILPGIIEKLRALSPVYKKVKDGTI
ncbi:MAG: cysteine desulfurase NifS [Syntrophaceae bacterium]